MTTHSFVIVTRVVLTIFVVWIAYQASYLFLPANTYWQIFYSLFQVDVLGATLHGQKSTKVMSNKVAYSFSWQTFTVTVDSGKTWHSWNYPDFKQVTGDDCGSFIGFVKMDSRGTGTLNTTDDCEGSHKDYKTRDFGFSWKDSKL